MRHFLVNSFLQLIDFWIVCPPIPADFRLYTVLKNQLEPGNIEYALGKACTWYFMGFVKKKQMQIESVDGGYARLNCG